MNQPTNIEMKIYSKYSDYSLGWLFKGARYHIWLQNKSKLPIKDHGDITLYKNSIADRGQPGHFRTRKLSGSIVSNKKIIDYVYDYAVKNDLFTKAHEAMLATKFEEERAIQMKAANDLAERIIAFYNYNKNCQNDYSHPAAIATFKNRLKEAGINLSHEKE